MINGVVDSEVECPVVEDKFGQYSETEVVEE